MKQQYKIGIIDDDQSKVTQMITMIRLCCEDENGQPLKEQYANYELVPVELELLDNLKDMVGQIVEERIDAVIIDYKLSSQKAISYTGVSLAKALSYQLWKFPIFILTTYQDDLFSHELFDSYLVFDFERYIGENEERVELNSKVIEQIKKYRIEFDNWKRELESLLPRAGESAHIDERILELDSKIERSMNGSATLPIPVKKGFAVENINKLISKIDQVIEGEKNNA